MFGMMTPEPVDHTVPIHRCNSRCTRDYHVGILHAAFFPAQMTPERWPEEKHERLLVVAQAYYGPRAVFFRLEEAPDEPIPPPLAAQIDDPNLDCTYYGAYYVFFFVEPDPKRTRLN
jgi:hypothetical protein